MGSPLTILTLVLAMLVTFTLAHGHGHGQPSQVPTCRFKCPPTDKVGHSLKEHSRSSSQLFCRYKHVPNDFFCKYHRRNGDLKQDHDYGNCPSAAIKDCTPRRQKRSAIPRAPAPPSPAAREVKPPVMKSRSELGKKKRREYLSD